MLELVKPKFSIDIFLFFVYTVSRSISDFFRWLRIHTKSYYVEVQILKTASNCVLWPYKSTTIKKKVWVQIVSATQYAANKRLGLKSLFGVSQPLNESDQTLVNRYLVRVLKLGVSQPKMRIIKRRDRNISLVLCIQERKCLVYMKLMMIILNI